MRMLSIAVAVSALAVAAAGCGGSAATARLAQLAEQDDALLQVDQIEKTWHRATSRHDLDLMMSIWAPNATLETSGGIFVGKAAIRAALAKAAPFQAQNLWVSETPAYKIRASINGRAGTLYFECHFVDVKTRKVTLVVAADMDVKEINDKWLITSTNVATPTLRP